MGKAIPESSIGKRMGKFQIVNVYSLTEKKDYSYLCAWTKKKTGWKETEL